MTYFDRNRYILYSIIHVPSPNRSVNIQRCCKQKTENEKEPILVHCKANQIGVWIHALYWGEQRQPKLFRRKRMI